MENVMNEWFLLTKLECLGLEPDYRLYVLFDVYLFLFTLRSAEILEVVRICSKRAYCFWFCF